MTAHVHSGASYGYYWPEFPPQARPPLRSKLSDIFNDNDLPSADASALSAPAEPQWLRPTIDRMNRLIRLPEDWDRHDGQGVRHDTAFFAIQILLQTLDSEAPIPFISPLSYGGIQIEWHEKGIDLEIEVVAPNKVIVNFQDSRTGMSDEDVTLSSNFGYLEDVISQLTQRQ